MQNFNVFPEALVSIGPVRITDTVAITWMTMAVITILAYGITRRLSLQPSGLQEVIESVYVTIEQTVKEVLPVDAWRAIPVIGTFWIFIGFSNLIGLLPGMKTPTADLNTTCAFAVISFSMTHVFGIKTQGLKGYLMHYRDPTWLLLPFEIIAELTRTVALAVRLFGNMLSGDMIAVVLLGIAGFLVPVPFNLLHIVIAIIQAYIFGVLTLVFIAGGVRTKE